MAGSWFRAVPEALVWLVDRWRGERDPESLAFDRVMGVDTARWTLEYEPVRPSVCREALGALPLGTDGHFVDLGCGKGRALLIAAEMGFDAATGVEVIRGLAETARQNVRRWVAERPEAPPIRVLHTDAMDLVLPRGDLVLFLYNPFGEEVMRSVLARAIRHGDAGNRVHLVYVNPLEADVLQSSWRLIEEGGTDPWAWRIYLLAS